MLGILNSSLTLLISPLLYVYFYKVLEIPDRTLAVKVKTLTLLHIYFINSFNFFTWNKCTPSSIPWLLRELNKLTYTPVTNVLFCAKILPQSFLVEWIDFLIPSPVYKQDRFDEVKGGLWEGSRANWAQHSRTANGGGRQCYTVGPLLMSTSLWVPPVWVLDHVKLISVLIASTN